MPMCLLHYLSGAFTHQPEELESNIGSKAGDLIKRSFDDIDPARLVDYHTQLAGIGTGATGAFVNPKMLTFPPTGTESQFSVSKCFPLTIQGAACTLSPRLSRETATTWQTPAR